MERRTLDLLFGLLTSHERLSPIAISPRGRSILVCILLGGRGEGKNTVGPKLEGMPRASRGAEDVKVDMRRAMAIEDTLRDE